MPDRVFRLYQRVRIVNVNVNIIAAGVLSTLLTLIPINLTRHFLGTDTIGEKLLITAIAGVFDLVLDVAIYFGLHWVANHWRPLRPRNAAERMEHRRKREPLLTDAGRVQVERMVLSPVYYVIALGGNFALLKVGVERELALILSFACAILVTRTAHTFWMIRTARRSAALSSAPTDAA